MIGPRARRLGDRTRRYRRRSGILMYHCITEASHDPWGICVSPRAFDEQMSVLAGRRVAADLGVLTDDASYTRAGSPIAVTFDDGYADNLLAALPVLERHDIPVTVFVIGDAIGRTRDFWWDALDQAIVSSPRLPAELDFPFGDGPRRFVLGDAPGTAEENRGWRADREPPRNARQLLFRTLWDLIVVLEPAAQDDAVDHLLAWAECRPARPAERPALTEAQLDTLLAHPLITIGSHTLDHVSLTDLPPEQQGRQIARGRARMEEYTGAPVTRFSYPYGRLNASARRAVAAAGIELACTSAALPAVRGDDPLALPRLQVTDCDGDGFARWLREEHRLAV
ncbi:polysaccharide deacetylase family protein [Gordonia sp. (in: high G+C Gram-positive bacteria)]|uniref:polysaccharide deacetylase family protein n=1 Tax=Gordonia sp. (in: high G+C Gram-positive bacteria) TaxID=84139 RepID=UPI003527210E